MKSVDIISIINTGASQFDSVLGEKIESNPDYKRAESKFLAALDSLDKSVMLVIDEAATTMETEAIDTAFNEGFKLAVKHIFSSVSI